MNAYEQKPWLAQYTAGVPASVTPAYPNALAMFRAAREKDPTRTQIFYFDHAVSVAEIDRLSDQLAVALRARGVGKGDRVAVYLQNVPQFVLAMLAAWKVGSTTAAGNARAALNIGSRPTSWP